MAGQTRHIRAPGSERAAELFRNHLARLKRNGCGLLVTGDEPADTRAHATRRLLGTTEPSESEVPRRRLLITTDPGIAVESYLPSGVPPDDDRVRVLSTGGPSRTAATASSPTVQPDEPDDSVDALIDAVETEIAGLLGSGEIRSGAFRLGVTSLLPLIDTFGRESAVEFCATVTEQVRQRNGMAHFHYPVPDDDSRVLTFSHQVDIRIELRQERDSPVECLWHTSYPEIDSHLVWTEF